MVGKQFEASRGAKVASDISRPAEVEIKEDEDGRVKIYPKGEDNVVFGFRSENEEYAAGSAEGIITLEGEKDPGRVIHTQKEKILWRKSFKKPVDCSVSNTGRVAVINRRELYAYDKDGYKLFSKRFDAPKFESSVPEYWDSSRKEKEEKRQKKTWRDWAGLPEKCAISPEGDKVAVTIGNPSYTFHVYDLVNNEEILSRDLPSGYYPVGFLKIDDKTAQIIIANLGMTIKDDPDFIVDIKSGETVGGKMKQKLDEVKKLYGKKK